MIAQQLFGWSSLIGRTSTVDRSGLTSVVSGILMIAVEIARPYWRPLSSAGGLYDVSKPGECCFVIISDGWSMGLVVFIEV
jgi:hypothetical protein